MLLSTRTDACAMARVGAEIDEAEWSPMSVGAPPLWLWPTPSHEWSVIIPYYNEQHYLADTIASLAAQSVGARLILVDNGSTDRSAAVARSVCEALGVDALHLTELRPGKVAALRRGQMEVTTRYVATCDADTLYPADYLARATDLLGRSEAVSAIAAYTPVDASPAATRRAGWRLALTSRLLPQQCLNGGAGQVFRSEALHRCGGFDPDLWNWVLEDHEIMARIEDFGRIVYDPGFVCHPATRPRSHDCTGWTLPEQLRYHATRRGERIGFFHDYLAPRLQQRALPSERLRRPNVISTGV